MTPSAKLRCSRFETEMDAADAKCPAPETYCQFRSSCLVWREMRRRELTEKLKDLRHQLEQLEKRMPAHTTPAIMAQEMDELEYEIQKTEKELEDLD